MTLSSGWNVIRRTGLAVVTPAAVLVLAGCGTAATSVHGGNPPATRLISLNPGFYSDRSFIEDQIASNQELLDRQQVLLGTPGHDPQLAAVVKEGTAQLQQDLAGLRAIQSKLPPSTAASPPV